MCGGVCNVWRGVKCVEGCEICGGCEMCGGVCNVWRGVKCVEGCVMCGGV